MLLIGHGDGLGPGGLGIQAHEEGIYVSLSLSGSLGGFTQTLV